MPDSHEEIEEKFREQMRAVGMTVDEIFNGHHAVNGGLKKTGFCLLTFKMGEPTAASKMNYICNANRKDMVRALEEFISREKRNR